MKTAMKSARAASAVVVCALAAHGLAQDERGGTPDAAMAAWVEMISPNAHHGRLSPFVGAWDADMMYQMAADAEPTHDTFRSTFTIIMDGRFLQEDVVSETEMGPFSGRGVIGYDNTKQAYVASWIDNMSTAMQHSEGHWDPSTARFEFRGESPSMSGEWRPVRSQMSMVKDGVFVVREWMTHEDGTEWLRFEATYRKRG